MLGKMGDAEQFNIRSKGGMGQLESFHFVPEIMKLTEEQLPKVKYIDPEIRVWHTVKLTMQGRTLSAEYDGDVLYDRFTYPDWMMNLEPAPIRLQKHVFFDDDDALGNFRTRADKAIVQYFNFPKTIKVIITAEVSK